MPLLAPGELETRQAMLVSLVCLIVMLLFCKLVPMI